jgi:hypothetical protein
VIDAVFICERVPGKTLAAADLDHLPSAERDSLFHRTGHLLRQIERQGFSHFDAKASNWIVFADPESGSMPVMIDVDGIRRRNWIALGIHRLLRSMHENPQYTPADSLLRLKNPDRLSNQLQNHEHALAAEAESPACLRNLLQSAPS